MKAPDKICVAPHQIFDYDLEIQEVGHNGAEEYIRKGALLEWIEEYRNTLSEFLKNKRSPVTAGKIYVLIKLLDKLNSM